MAWRGGNRGANATVPPFDNAPNAMLATADYNRFVRLWSLKTGNCIKLFDYHVDQINAMNFTTTGRDLVVASHGRADLYDVSSGNTPKVSVFVPKNIVAVGFHSSGHWMYSGGEDGICRLWEMRNGQMGVARSLPMQQGVLSMAVNPNQTEIFVSTNSGHVFVWNIVMNRFMQIVVPNDMVVQEVFHKLSCHPSGNILVGVTNKGRIVKWDLETREIRGPVTPAPNPFEPEEKDTAIRARINNPNVIRRFAYGYGLSIRVSPGGAKIVVAGSGSDLHVYNTDTMKLSKIGTRCGWNWDAVFSSDSRHLFSGGNDNLVKVWDVARGKQVGQLEGHNNAILAMCIIAPVP